MTSESKSVGADPRAHSRSRSGMRSSMRHKTAVIKVLISKREDLRRYVWCYWADTERLGGLLRWSSPQRNMHTGFARLSSRPRESHSTRMERCYPRKLRRYHEGLLHVSVFWLLGCYLATLVLFGKTPITFVLRFTSLKSLSSMFVERIVAWWEPG